MIEIWSPTVAVEMDEVKMRYSYPLSKIIEAKCSMGVMYQAISHFTASASCSRRTSGQLWVTKSALKIVPAEKEMWKGIRSTFPGELLNTFSATDRVGSTPCCMSQVEGAYNIHTSRVRLQYGPKPSWVSKWREHRRRAGRKSIIPYSYYGNFLRSMNIASNTTQS